MEIIQNDLYNEVGLCAPGGAQAPAGGEAAGGGAAPTEEGERGGAGGGGEEQEGGETARGRGKEKESHHRHQAFLGTGKNHGINGMLNGGELVMISITIRPCH